MGERLYPTKRGDPGQPLLTNWTNNRKLGDFKEPEPPPRVHATCGECGRIEGHAGWCGLSDAEYAAKLRGA